ncbi:unnamed protein product, partial [Brassica rapa subsp. trilocularis]
MVVESAFRAVYRGGSRFFLLPDLLLCVGEIRWSGGGSLARRRVMCALLASPVELDMELFPVCECGSEGFCVVAVAAA